MTTPRPEARTPRAALERHVVEVQKTIRTCADCGLCCTEAYNSAAILPLEAERVATHLRKLSLGQRARLLARLKATIKHYSFETKDEPSKYTCSFLEKDMTCVLPLSVKPTVCLSFNPHTEDACDQEPDWFHRAHDAVEVENRRRRLAETRLPIPVAVLAALEAADPDGSDRRGFGRNPKPPPAGRPRPRGNR